MKKAFYIFICFSILKTFSGQTPNQGLKISINELTEEGNHPLSNTTVDVIINDTIKHIMTSDNKGYLNLIKLPKGRCSIKVCEISGNRVSCEFWGAKSIVINEKKITHTSITFACGAYREYLRKKEKKDLAYIFFHHVFFHLYGVTLL